MQQTTLLPLSRSARLLSFAPSRSFRLFCLGTSPQGCSLEYIDYDQSDLTLKSAGWHEVPADTTKVLTSDKNDLAALVSNSKLSLCSLQQSGISIKKNVQLEGIQDAFLDKSVCLCKLSSSFSLLNLQKQLPETTLQCDASAAWAFLPSKSMLASSSAAQIVLRDISSNNQIGRVSKGQVGVVTCLQFSPCRSNLLLSSGLDFCSKFWDIRRFEMPLKVIEHQAIPVKSKLNPKHEELILFSYDDGTVAILSHASLISKTKTKERLIKRFDQHEQAVEDLTWAGNSAWLFFSGSKTGQVVLAGVPSSQKFRILL